MNNFNNLNNNITSTVTATNHSSKNKNKNLLIDKNGNIYQNLYNIVKVDNKNKDILNYEKEKERINNNENNLKNKNFINDNRILREKNLTINNYLSNNKVNIPYDNIEHKIKLQKMKKRNNNLSDNKIF